METRSTALRFLAIPTDVAERARRTMTDDFGHALSIAKREGPCRHCLRLPLEAEDLILMSYRALDSDQPYAEIGPIFIHPYACERYPRVDEFPADFCAEALVVRAYDTAGEIADAALAPAGEAERYALDFLQHPDVAEVHFRHPAFTCFLFKAVRAA